MTQTEPPPAPAATPPTWKSFIGLTIGVFVVGVVVFTIGHHLVITSDAERVSSAAGLVAAMYSGLAFAGVIYALSLQRRELQLQREELSQTRSILSQQNDTLKLQRFEASFFNLLRSHRDLVASTTAIFTNQSAQPLTGMHAFGYAAGELTARFLIQFTPQPTPESFHRLADGWFRDVCYQPMAEFGHYLRSLYHLVRFVADADIPDKWPYVQLLRSQLSNGEQVMLFFYGLTSDGNGMKAYIERFHLLRGVREDPSVTRFRASYKPAAFGDTNTTTLPEPPELAV